MLLVGTAGMAWVPVTYEGCWLLKVLASQTFIMNYDTICTVWKSTWKRDHAQKFPWNQLFSSFFDIDLTEKMLIFRKNGDRIL